MDIQQLPLPARPDGDELQHMLNAKLCCIDCKLEHEADTPPSAAAVEDVQLGALDVVRFEGCGLKGARRSLQHIREDGIDDFYLVMPLTSAVALSQSSRSIILEPGASALLSAGLPFEGHCSSTPNQFYSQMTVRVPASNFRQHVPYVDECCTRPIPVTCGVGKVLRSLVDTLLEERSNCSGSRAERFGAMLLGTIVNTVLDALDPAGMHVPHQNACSRIFEQASNFIESHLSDPALDPARVAQHCRISVSYLHAAFAAAASQGVGAFIRESRLQRCREALQNPFLRHRSIIGIAMQWGFNSAPGFTRAYRARFGLPPSEDRGSVSESAAAMALA